MDIQFNQAGELTGLRQIWRFDAIYSAYAVAGTDKDGDGTPDPDQLNILLHVNMEQLSKYNYFTDISLNNRPLAIAAAQNTEIRYHDNQLEMRFTTPLETPIAATNNPIEYAIYDPTYYAEIRHVAVQDAISVGDQNGRCDLKKTMPKPTMETILIASKLDDAGMEDVSVGVFFADRVAIQCRVNPKTISNGWPIEAGE